MINEANSDLSHGDLIDYAASWIRSAGGLEWTEFRLPNKTIADVLHISIDGVVTIIECKQSQSTWEIPQAVSKYASMAHRLYIAAPALPTPYIDPTWGTALKEARMNHLGFLIVDREGVLLARRAVTMPMDASTLNRVLTRMINHPRTPQEAVNRLISMANVSYK
jgi:hypothetical protein